MLSAAQEGRCTWRNLLSDPMGPLRTSPEYTDVKNNCGGVETLGSPFAELALQDEDLADGEKFGFAKKHNRLLKFRQQCARRLSQKRKVEPQALNIPSRWCK